MWVAKYIIALRVQKSTGGKYKFDEEIMTQKNDYKVSKETKRATKVFLVTLLALLIYGVVAKSGVSYAIFVMITVAVLTGLAAGLKIVEVTNLMIEGMSKLLWMFEIFVVF